MLSVDGSYGEGGGQILRTALALAAVSAVPVRIEGIRAKRSKPGIRPQRLTAVQAVARVAQAEVTGAHLGSQALTFRPRALKGGHYRVNVAETTGSAGAVTLIAQALLPALVKIKSPATIILQGGTHVPWSPPAHYLSHVFLPALAVMRAKVEMVLGRLGLVSPRRRRGAPHPPGRPPPDWGAVAHPGRICRNLGRPSLAAAS